MKKVPKNILLITALCASTSAAIAAFYPKDYVERIYYSSPDKQHEVGDYTQFCNGSIYRSGETTAYYSELRIPCNRGGNEP